MPGDQSNLSWVELLTELFNGTFKNNSDWGTMTQSEFDVTVGEFRGDGATLPDAQATVALFVLMDLDNHNFPTNTPDQMFLDFLTNCAPSVNLYI